MTATAARDRYDPGPRKPHSTRLARDTKAAMRQAVADGEARNVQEWGEQVTEAALGYVRCRRLSCVARTPPIPVEFGDITGMTFGQAAALAFAAADDQHPRHETVRIGAEPSAPGERERIRTAALMQGVVPPASPRAVRFVEPAVKP